MRVHRKNKRAAVAQWLRASNLLRQIFKSTSEWRGSSPAGSISWDLNSQENSTINT